MAMNYLWGDMYPSASVLNTAQQTIPEAADKAVLPADNGTDDAAAAAGIKDAGKSNATTKEIFIFMLILLIVAFVLGSL